MTHVRQNRTVCALRHEPQVHINGMHSSIEKRNHVSIICQYIKMNYQLRDKIARKMWQMWSEANRPHLDRYNCPEEFYFMAEIAMKCVCREIDDMILELVKQRLEKLV